MESPVILVKKDHLAIKVIMDHLDNWDHLVTPVHVVSRETLDQQAKRDPMEKRVKPDIQDKREMLV